MKITMLCFFTFLIATMGQAQEKNKSISFEIKGNCGMCKSRIEKTALKLKGVKMASWDAGTKVFQGVIDERKCSIEDIKKSIAEVGHDSEGFNAPKQIYDNLPPCCKYRDPDSMLMEHGNH